MNAPSQSRAVPGANAQIGIMSRAPASATAIVRRRPSRSEYSPQITPPTSAPTCENAVTAARAAGPSPQSRSRKVGYMSWVPCDTMIIRAIRIVR